MKSAPRTRGSRRPELSGVDAIFDAVTDVLVDVCANTGRPLQDRFGDAVEQMAREVVDEPVTRLQRPSPNGPTWGVRNLTNRSVTLRRSGVVTAFPSQCPPPAGIVLTLAACSGNRSHDFDTPSMTASSPTSTPVFYVAGPFTAGVTSTMRCLVNGCPLCWLWSVIAQSTFNSGM